MSKLEFKDLETAIFYALHNFHKKTFEFVVDGKVYSTDKVSRRWACSLIPSLYYELYDEEKGE